MSGNECFFALRQTAILRGLRDGAVTRLAAQCRTRDYVAGSVIFSADDVGTDVFFLASGKVQAIIYSTDGVAVLFRWITPGEVFGELAILDGGRRSATVEAVEPSMVVICPATAFLSLLEAESTIAMEILRRCVADIRRLSNRVNEVATLSVQGRIRSELLRLCTAEKPEASGVLLSPAPSLFEIASRISTHREAVSRELTRLTGMGILRRERTGLRVLDTAKLEQLVREARGES